MKAQNIPKSWRIVVGLHAMREVVKTHPRQIKKIVVKQGWESSRELKELAASLRAIHVPLEVVSPIVLEKMTPAHQGAALYVDGAPELNFDNIKTLKKCILLVLDGIEDPHNLGAILRTSWLMGVSGILIPSDRAVGLTPVVHKVACGGVEHVPVMENNSFSNSIERLKEDGFWVFGLSHKASKKIFDLKLPEKIVLIIGNEEKGMRTTTEKLCDELVKVPQLCDSASYNASVSAGIALYEASRQHSVKI